MLTREFQTNHTQKHNHSPDPLLIHSFSLIHLLHPHNWLEQSILIIIMILVCVCVYVCMISPFHHIKREKTAYLSFPIVIIAFLLSFCPIHCLLSSTPLIHRHGSSSSALNYKSPDSPTQAWLNISKSSIDISFS